MIKEGISKVIDGIDLSFQEAKEIMEEIMTGKTTDAQIGSFLTALRLKGETVDEIVAFVSVMRKFCNKLTPKVKGRLVDTCGTGGDNIKTFNISTIAAFVVAGAGIPVAKHGNRAVTGSSGSADVLEKLGLNLDSEPKVIEHFIESIGIGFMFAPKFHPAMKYAVGPRREMGIRTVFNILGPLTNPASADAQILGTYNAALVEPMIRVLNELGTEAAYVVHGLDGLDEISTIGETRLAELKDGNISIKNVKPKDFGLRLATSEQIAGTSPEENAVLTFKLLNNLIPPEDPKMEIVLLNAAAGIAVGGKADDLIGGIETAKESIDSGSAYKKLRALVKTSNGRNSALEELEQKYA